MEVIYRSNIDINDNRKLSYAVIQEFLCDYHIDESFYNGQELEKNYSFHRSSDYAFNAIFFAGDDSKLKTLSFSFDVDHPLYVPLLHLIDYDGELIIDDDDTREENKKYLKIYKKGDIIFLDFYNLLENDRSFERFNVFIKNITFDGRSKVDHQNKDTRKRLNEFYSEAFDRQITLEQWCVANHIDATGFRRVRTNKRKKD